MDRQEEGIGKSANIYFAPLIILPAIWILLAGWIGRKSGSRTLTQVLMYPAALVLVNTAFGLLLLIPALFLLFRESGPAIVATFPDICLLKPVGLPLLNTIWSAIFGLGRSTTWGTLDPGTSPILVVAVQLVLLLIVKPTAEWLGDVAFFWGRDRSPLS